MEITTLIPRHSSSLSFLKHYIISWSNTVTSSNDNKNDGDRRTRKRKNDNVDPCDDVIKNDATTLTTSHVLTIQCYKDGIAWNVFRPLFFKEDNGDCNKNEQNEKERKMYAKLAACLLLHFFSCHIYPLEENHYTIKRNEDNVENDDEGKEKNKERDCQTDNNEGFSKNDSAITANVNNSSSSAPPLLWHEKRLIMKQAAIKMRHCPRRVLLILLPPYPIYHHCQQQQQQQQHNQFSTTHNPPNLHPEYLFTSHLIQQQNLFLRLKTLNAFLATLGGGYFLCRYLSTAIALARYQRYVAYMMGDIDLASRCTINEAYNYIHAGRIVEALGILRKVKAEARGRGDDLTVSMCKSAILFGKRVGQACLYEGDCDGQEKVKKEEMKSAKKGKEDDPSGGVKDNEKKEKKSLGEEKMQDGTNHTGEKNDLSATNPTANGRQQTVDDFQRIRIFVEKPNDNGDI